MTVVHTLAVSALDDSGAALAIRSAELLQGTPAAAVVTVAGTSPRISIDALSPGNYTLRLSLPGRPAFVLPVRISSRSSGMSVDFPGARPICCSLSRVRVGSPGAWTEMVFDLVLTLSGVHEAAVFVAGWDYSGGANDLRYCETYRDDLFGGVTYRSGARTSIPKRLGDSTVVALFDFATGYRMQMVKAVKGWTILDKVLQGTVPTCRGRYDDPANQQRRRTDDSISVIHVYDYIADLGRDAPGCLKEFHFFSHAWAGGPILVDTYQDAAYTGSGALVHLRDPGDKDPRQKDFSAANMPRIAEFRAAFAAGAQAKIWGCQATYSYRNLIRAAARAVRDTDTVTFDWEGRRVTTTKAQAKSVLTTWILPNSYMSKLKAAVGPGLKVNGSPPGMDARLKSVRAGGATREYMFVKSSDFRVEMQFLKNEIGLTFDEFGYLDY